MDSHACSVKAMGSHLRGVARGEDASGSATPLAMRTQRHPPRSSRTNHHEPYGDFARTHSPYLVTPSGSSHVGHEAKAGTITFATRLKRIHVWVPQGQINACRGAARPLEASVCAARPEYTGLVCHGATSAFRFRGTQGQNDGIRWHAWPERRDQVARMVRYGKSVGTIPNPVDRCR
jgi:hypothetical protein